MLRMQKKTHLSRRKRSTMKAVRLELRTEETG
jgi:hypothetical protein